MMNDDEFAAVEANLNPFQKNVIALLGEGMSDIIDIAAVLEVPVEHVCFAMLALEGMGLVEPDDDEEDRRFGQPHFGH